MTDPNSFTDWRKASYSGGADNCVEVAHTDHGTVGVRDSKHPAGTVLEISARQWKTFIAAVHAGGFDR